MMKLRKKTNKLIIHCIKTINFFKRMKLKEKIKRVFHKITIPQWIKNIWQRIKKFFLERFFDFAAVVLIALLLVILASLIVRIIGNESHWLDDWLGTDRKSNAKYQTLRSLALLSAGLGGLLGLFISNRRAKAMTDSVDAQVKANENTTFHEAIKHLGDSSASVRLGGIYALYDLALSNPEKYLKNIIEILSAHVRATTQEDEYRTEYRTKPSNEISSLIKLLSDLNKEYPNKEVKSSPLDLSDTYLCGVYLRDLDFSYAIFTSSNFANAKLYSSNFAGANLWESNFAGANLWESNFAGAHLYGSHFEGANLWKSHFAGAFLWKSHFAGANLLESNFAGANLLESNFAGANLLESHFEGANLLESNFAGANLLESHFEGAYGDQDESIGDFKKRIENRKGKKAEIGNTMVFAGGITEKHIKDLEKIVENTSPFFTADDDRKKEFNKRMNQVIEVLKTHQDKPMSHKIPEYPKGNIFLGKFTEKRANEIIQLYEEVMKIHDEIKKKHK